MTRVRWVCPCMTITNYIVLQHHLMNFIRLKEPSSIVDELLVGFQFDYTTTVPKGFFYGWMYRTYGVIAPKFRRKNNKFVGGNVIPFL